MVRRQVFLRCPLTDALVSEKFCQNCKHNFGGASDRDIYCAPEVDRLATARRQHRQNLKEKAMMERGEYITVDEV